MENLIISLNAVLPLFCFMVLGWILRRLNLYDDRVLKVINSLCFKVFLPFSLFKSTATTDLKAAFNGKLVLYGYLSLTALFIILMIVVPRHIKENPKRGAVIQGIFRSNLALFGLPLAISLVGEEQAGTTALMVGLITPALNVFAVICLETFRGGTVTLRKIIKGIVTNPLIIACVAGILISVSGITLPYFVEKTVGDVGKIATPLALIVMGGGFVFSRISANIRILMPTVLAKILIVPALAIIGGIALGFRGETLIPIMIMYGAPTAVSSYVMASTMDADAELASEIVVFTTLFSIATMFVFIFTLKQLAFI